MSGHFVELSREGICTNCSGVGRIDELGLFEPGQKVLAVGQPLDNRACRRPDGVKEIETGIICDEDCRWSCIRCFQFVFPIFWDVFLHKYHVNIPYCTYLLQAILTGYAKNKMLRSIHLAYVCQSRENRNQTSFKGA